MMHILFGEWYRKASIEPESQQLLARSRAIEAFVKTIDQSKILDLVRYFVGLPWKDAATYDEFRRAFQTMDAAFPMRDNEVEVRVLAGATIIAVSEQELENSNTAAMLLAAAGAPGLRKAPVVPEILTLTEKYLFERSAAIRSVPRRSQLSGTTHDQLIEDVKTACAANQVTELTLPLENVLRSLSHTLKKFAQAAEAAFASVEKAAAVQEEESNIIWWIFGNTSRDVWKHFSDLPSGFAAVLAGKELADLTRLLPGPRAAPAYLDKILGKLDSNKIGLADISLQVPAEWLSHLHFDEKLLDLCPILHTMHEAARQRNGEAAAAARKQLGISESCLTPLEMAVQMYHECLALRSFQKH